MKPVIECIILPPKQVYCLSNTAVDSKGTYPYYVTQLGEGGSLKYRAWSHRREREAQVSIT